MELEMGSKWYRSIEVAGPFHCGKKNPESFMEEVALELGPVPPIFAS